MTIDEIIKGESKNLEFKVELPKDSSKYIKTVIAFANTQGGTIVVGIEDQTRTVVGISEELVFSTMDAIASVVSDSCIPQIVPDIEPKTVEGKTVIEVTIEPGQNRPYYLKSKGKDKGTYIRVAGTTRLANPEKIKELEMEGSRISWDEQTCIGYKVTDKAVRKLCSDIKSFRNQAGLENRSVTKAQLVNWKLLKDNNGTMDASNAFVLLSSDYFQFSKTQCAVFKGTERTVFLDKREYTGPLYEQIEAAVDFVLRNIRLGAVIDGLVRRESYELPVAAIREMIINAHCHRSYTEESCVQVAVYDDRLEVTSPGGLYNGLTYEAIMNGRSSIRNRAIANVFSQMGLVESWGTGIKRIIAVAKEYGLRDPEFIEFDVMFRVNLDRNISPNHVGENVGNVGENVGEPKDIQDSIIAAIVSDNKISAKALAEQFNVTERTIERNIKALRESGRLIRHGAAHGGYWEVVSK